MGPLGPFPHVLSGPLVLYVLIVSGRYSRHSVPCEGSLEGFPPQVRMARCVRLTLYIRRDT